MFKATVKNATRGRALNCLCLTAALFASASVAYAQDDTDVIAVQGQQCAVDRYNAVNGSSVTALNCTANDFVATTTATSPIGIPCPVGTQQTLPLDLSISSGSAIRYDAAIFVAETGGNPNTAGGTCSVATFPTSGILDGTASWFDASGGNPNNTCGDYQKNKTTSNLVENVKITCQYDNNNKLAIPFMLTYGQNAAPAVSCTGPANNATFPVAAGTTAKCNVVSVVVTNVNVTFNADPACSKTVAFDLATLTVTATIHIVNNDPVNLITADGAPNIPFDDVIPAPVSVTNAVCTNQSLGAQCPQDVALYPPIVVAGNDVSGKIPFLPVGGSVDIVITGTIPSAQNTAYSNTATITPDPLSFPADVVLNNTCPSNEVTLPVKLQSFDVK